MLKYIIKKTISAELINTETGRVICSADSISGFRVLYDKQRELLVRDLPLLEQTPKEDSDKIETQRHKDSAGGGTGGPNHALLSHPQKADG